MKTFEERLTAWMDDQLPAEEQAAFEQDLAARPDAASFYAEKRLALQLRGLLRSHLQAPPLTNADFFNHGIQERIAAEARREQTDNAGRLSPWRRFLAAFQTPAASLTPGRLLAAGAACLLLASVGVFTLIPPSAGPGRNPGALAQTAPPTPTAAPVVIAETTPAPAPAPSQAAPAAPHPGGNDQLVLNTRPPADQQLSDSFQLRVPSDSKVTATPLHFDDQNADVLWLDGLDDLPEVNGNAPAASPGASDANPAPAPPAPPQP